MKIHITVHLAERLPRRHKEGHFQLPVLPLLWYDERNEKHSGQTVKNLYIEEGNR